MTLFCDNCVPVVVVYAYRNIHIAILIGASLSEPHTSVLNGGFSYYIIYYISAVRTSFRKWKSSLEESYFWALTQSFTFSVLDYKLF